MRHLSTPAGSPGRPTDPPSFSARARDLDDYLRRDAEERLRRENDGLRRELEQAKEALKAISEGQIDAVHSAAAGTPLLLRAAQEDLRASRQLLRAVFDGIGDALLLVRTDGTLADINSAAAELFGIPRAGVQARTLTELEAAASGLREAFDDVRSGVSRSGRLHLERSDGQQRLVDYASTPRIRPDLNLLVLRDVTEQRALEARFQAMIEKSQDGVSLISAEAKTFYQSPAAQRMFGWSLEDLEQKSWHALVPADDHQKLEEALTSLLAEPGSSREVGFRLRHRDGQLRAVELQATNLLHDPLVAAIVTNFRDVTARKAMERENVSFFELTVDMLGIAGMDGRFRRVNRAFTETLGWSEEELTSRPWVDFIHPDDRDATERQSLRLAAGVESARFENRYRTRSGEYRWLQWSCKLVSEDGLIYAAGRDVTEQRASAERYGLLFTESPFPKFVLDGHTRRFVDVNEAAIELYGYSRDEFLAMHVDEVLAPTEHADLEEVWTQALTVGRVQLTSRRHVVRGGGELEVDLTAKRVAPGGRATLLLTIRDMTAQRKLETQLAQSQKLESLGNLAGGIAHDFNNLMSIVLSYTFIMLEELGPEERYHAEIVEIRNAAERATDLTRQLLAFSRQQILEPQVVSLVEVFTGMERMLKRLLREDIALTFVAAPELGLVLADPGQLEQVILNLAVNARDAMSAGGRLQMEAFNLEVREDQAPHPDGLRPGKYVALTVTDTGHGMDAPTRARIFEPFFTTKPTGKGTGLGLSTVFGIVRQSGGHVAVSSELGEGTTFRVYLPRTDKPRRVKSLATQGGSVRGTETILVVEDEAQVRSVIRTILRRAGYEVLDAANGEEALKLLGMPESESIDLLLTDVVMPGMGGRALAERVEERRPGTRVLYMSGYTDDVTVQHGSLYQKPVKPLALLRKVREVLDSPR
jgi:two-component system, cell cycle sensor histidine kinase and response regulator CckA